MNDLSSVFTAELLAIETGLNALKKYANKTCTFYSDSLSSLQAIKSAKVEDKRIGVIYEILKKLSSQKITVQFCWVPGHSGIPGNELADETAKRACHLPSPVSREVSSADCKAYVKAKVRESWERRWRNLTDNKKLKSIQEDVTKKVMKLSRMDEIKVTRLRIGHTRLTHNSILMGEEVPRCIECEVPISIKHILMSCGNNYADRMSCYDHTTINLKTLLNSSLYIPKVLEFLKKIDMYKEI